MFAAHDAPAPAGVFVRATLVRIVDGDTIVVDLDNGMEGVHVRLRDMDAPETKQGAEGAGATAALTALLGDPGRAVVLAVAPRPDKYRRTLATVYVDTPGGRVNVNERMVRDGWAWAYDVRAPTRAGGPYAAHEAEARAARRGLWADTTHTHVRPHDWRAARLV
jgi:micrococcal nuclease